MEALGRVELPTNGLGNRCSIHLSYRATRRNRLHAVLVYRNRELRIVGFLGPSHCPVVRGDEFPASNRRLPQYC